MKPFGALGGILLLMSGVGAEADKPDATDGFVSIFDGTLKDCDGDPLYWKAEIVREPGDRAELQKKILKEDWNQIHIIASGNLLQHFTNGVLMSEVGDEDPEQRRISGLLGVQVHVGPPMKIEFRNIRLKRTP